MENVAIIGATHKTERYAYQCMQKLESNGHNVLLVGVGKADIEGRVVHSRLKDIKESVDTVTMYINPTRQEDVISDILVIKPKRVIFNPGTENSDVYSTLKENGIEIIEACTLVMLSTGQF